MSAEHPPLVSIVLPTYNRANVLAGAVESVLKQSYPHFELIIVDDNSPDNTTEVVQSFNDKRIKYIKNETNLKLPGALNRGFAEAQGELLTWTSDDNFYFEQAIEEMVSALRDSPYDLVYADYYEFETMDEVTSQPKDPKLVRLPDSLTLEKGNQVGACFLYTRKAYETVGDYDTGLFLVEDYDYWIRISALFKAKHIDKALYYFRRDDNTLYCSRFCEIKASDLLIRYKNRLLNQVQVIDALNALILNNVERLKNPLLKGIYKIIKKTSYRLTRFYLKWLKAYFGSRLKNKVADILDAYDKKQKTYIETKDALKDYISRFAQIEYQ